MVHAEYASVEPSKISNVYAPKSPHRTALVLVRGDASSCVAVSRVEDCVSRSVGVFEASCMKGRARNAKTPPLRGGVFAKLRCLAANEEPDDYLLSHGYPHYHWRGVVSRSCSGWEGVVPTRYGHQA